MAQPTATLRVVAGDAVLLLDRRFAAGPERVWRAVSDPAELARWFPAAVEGDLRVGGRLRFSFSDAPADAGDGGEGQVTEFEPPRVFGFLWNRDALRFEVAPDDAGAGTRFTLTHAAGGAALGRLAAARTAHGWDTCLAALEALLEGRDPEAASESRTGRLAAVERYVAEFGLDEGTAVTTPDGFVVSFARDLLWTPLEDAWAVLTGGKAAEVGGVPPAGTVNEEVGAGPVTEADAPRVLEYTWTHEGAAAGTVRWTLVHEPGLGNRVELTQTVPERLEPFLPTALAAWHTHLERYFAEVVGGERRPWPADRTEELRGRYAARLD
ncbi:SRPBCC domain-containing protein [Nocardiopsis sp. YSL2]|uniref:SRPBCC domain-containing protein n=1 Tax=Nocardiopsis sp. YSL2 TaxID=2939492 RepID=UPI0026F443A1|nr:SRPBCC domain-containing protein [Nocardiopsis sp. YSL2]